MDIDVFIPCLVDQFYPDTAFNMIKVLEKAGCKVHYNKEQTCCGYPAYDAGQIDLAKEVGSKLVADMLSDRAVVGLSGTCVGHVRVSMASMMKNSVSERDHFDLQNRFYEFTEYLVNVAEVYQFGAELAAKAVYMDACNARHLCGIKEGPRKLLQEVNGLQLIELNDGGLCCGFGGNMAFEQPGTAARAAEQKLQNILKAKVELIISSDMSCLMHLDKIIKSKSMPLRVMHIADVLAIAL